MAFTYSIFFLSCIIFASTASPLAATKRNEEKLLASKDLGPRSAAANFSVNANPFVEELLERARPMIRANLEPVLLPDYSFEISQSVIVAEVKAVAGVHDGQLTGLSTLHRAGDAFLTTSNGGTTYSIDAHLGVSNIAGNYRGEVTFMSLGPSISVHLTVKTLSVKVGVIQGISGSEKTPPVLATFNIENLGQIVIDFDGLGPLDWIINPLSNFLLNKISGFIAWIVESPLHSLIAELLPKIKMPTF